MSDQEQGVPEPEAVLAPTVALTGFAVNGARMPDGSPIKIVHIEVAIDIPLDGDAARGMADALTKGLVEIARTMPGPAAG